MEIFRNMRDNLAAQEAAEVNAAALEQAALEPELTDVPGVGEVLVGGDPFGIADQLDDDQGDNVVNFRGDCGLVSVHNILTMAGMESSEDAIVLLAIRNNLCHFSSENSPDHNGGTTVQDRKALLEICGIQAEILNDKSGNASLDAIAAYVDAGHGVNMSVNAGYAWDEPYCVGDGGSNHSIVVTGTVYDPDTGALKGLLVCDSGLPGDSAARFMSIETLQDAYVDAPRACVLVTNDPIRS